MTRETSRKTFLALVASGLLLGKQQQILDLLIDTPATSGEVLAAIPGIKNVNAWRARFTELQARGLIREVGARRCKVSNRTCLVWEATGRETPLNRHNGHTTSKLAQWKACAAALAEDLRGLAPGRKRSLAEFDRLGGA